MTVSGVKPGIEAEEAAARDVVARVNVAWDHNSPEEFAAVYSEDATLILSGDRYFAGRENIRQALQYSFETEHKGTRLLTYIVSFRWISPQVASMVTEGGVLMPGETEPDWERALRATWVAAKQPNGSYQVVSYHNGRRADGALRGQDE